MPTLSSGRFALTAQLSATFWPVLVPPWTVSPQPVRTFSVTSTPLKYRYHFPYPCESMTRLLIWPASAGLTS